MSFEASFQSLVEQFGERVYNQALRILGNREEAEEATQDVFVRIWQALPKFRGDAKISTWIWRITTNVCISRRNKKTADHISFDDENKHSSIAIEDRSGNPWQQYVAREEQVQLEHLISRLPVEEAAAITLFYLEGLDYKEIADVMQLPIGTVATKLHRGRERLRQIINSMKEV